VTKIKNVYGVGIVGCGLIGQKRARSLGPRGKLLACADIEIKKADELASQFNSKSFNNWRELIAMKEIDIIIVSTLHDSLSEITMAGINSNKNILVEKPAARTSLELEPIVLSLQKRNVKVRVGFNHRYHRALLKAKEIVLSGGLGELMFIRARYGHGARLGYEKEWRANPILSGGGELIDQGPHLIDLSRWFLGDFTEIDGFAHTYFWQMPVDDNGFMLLKTQNKQVAFLHVSCTEWKNIFSMEIYGKLGKIEITGLGGSYGLEKVTHYKMLPQMGPPETVTWEYPMIDTSWAVEMNEFYEDIDLDRSPAAGINDAYQALKIIEKIYKISGYDHRT
jgi:predicted dehydrogenase